MRGIWAGWGRIAVVACVLTGWVAWSEPANAQPFPSRPITLVVPFAAGGPTDTLGRILSERIAAELRTTGWSRAWRGLPAALPGPCRPRAA